MSSDIEWQADERPTSAGGPAAGDARGVPAARRVFGVPPTPRGARQ
ncbi:hypothetical protein NE236_16765 [Actinoallomurus purpureus]|nr:hypothetical protein [Actinoallomurus purpureus]MCO6006639.1 hypothetical protein [Actinoallomurus purpureus]